MSYGKVEYNGVTYLEKFHVYPAIVTLLASQLLTNQRVVMQGEAPFLLKQLTRTKTGNFRFRLGNSDGTWYSSAGVGGTNDRVRDDLMFGTGQFPFEVVPYILFSQNGSITFDIEDISAAPNTIEFAFIGSLLFPA